MTAAAVGPAWRQATPEQQKRLQDEFKILLVRTYSGALAQVNDQIVSIKPQRSAPTDTDVVVRTEVRGRGDPIQLDYRLEKTPGQGAGWKIYNLNVLGVWLVETYRSQFAQQISDKGRRRADRDAGGAQQVQRARRADGNGPLLILPAELTHEQAAACCRMLAQGMRARAEPAVVADAGCPREVRFVGPRGAAGVPARSPGAGQDLFGEPPAGAAARARHALRGGRTAAGCGVGPIPREKRSTRPGLKLRAHMPAISFQSVSKIYPSARNGPLKALDGVSFDIRQGEFFGLLGPNGAGKTTLISILAGLVRAEFGPGGGAWLRRAGRLRQCPPPARGRAAGTGVRSLLQRARVACASSRATSA